MKDNSNRNNTSRYDQFVHSVSATRLQREHINEFLINSLFQDIFLIYPSEKKYETEKLEILEQLLHHVNPKDKTINANDWLSVVQHIKK